MFDVSNMFMDIVSDEESLGIMFNLAEKAYQNNTVEDPLEYVAQNIVVGITSTLEITEESLQTLIPNIESMAVVVSLATAVQSTASGGSDDPVDPHKLSHRIYEILGQKMGEKTILDMFREYVEARRHEYEYPYYDYSTDIMSWDTPLGIEKAKPDVVSETDHYLVTYFRHYFMWDLPSDVDMKDVRKELTTKKCMNTIREVFSR